MHLSPLMSLRVHSQFRILSCKSGNPISIADEDISVLPPSPLVRAFIPFTDVANVLKPGEDHITGSAAILWRYTTLTKILGDISTSMCSTVCEAEHKTDSC